MNRSRFSLPHNNLFLHSYLETWANQGADRTALWELNLQNTECDSVGLPTATPRGISWRELSQRVFQARDSLQKFGVSVGDRVALVGPNSPNWIVALLAIHQCGAVDVPIDRRYKKNQVDELIARAGCVAIVSDLVVVGTDQKRATSPSPSIPSLPSHRNPRFTPYSLASLQWTSGTRGVPKGVLLSHHNLSSNAHAKWNAVPQSESDVRLTMLPLAHAYARTCDLGTWLISGGQLAVVDGLEPFLYWLPIVRPHLVNTVPLVIDRLITAAGKRSVRDFCGGNLRWLGCGGAPLSGAMYQRLTDDGISVIQGYGMTETSPVICSATPFDGRPNYVGKPVDGVSVRIDEQGELWYRGAGLMQRYLDDGNEIGGGMASRMRDGWFRTGDLATMDHDGQIRILGRKDEVLVLSSGHKVHPVELERAILTDPRIEQVVVFADQRGLGAFVWPRQENETIESLEAVIATALRERYWYEQIRFIVRLPRPLTITDGELTIKGSPRRELIQHRYNR